MAKWRLFLTVIPFTGLFCLAKLASHRLGFELWAFDSLTGALFGAASFVIAFVLSGTLSAYNDSEAMVLDAVNAVEALADSNRLFAQSHGQDAADPMQTKLVTLLADLEAWLLNGIRLEQLQHRLTDVHAQISSLYQRGEGTIARDCLGELARLRLLISRMHVNRSTSFLGPAYAMLEIFLFASVVALLLIKAELFSENLIISCFIFTSFTYLLLLIRDLDNPFQYDGSSCVDTDLTPLRDAQNRLLASSSQRCAERGGTPNPATA